MVKSTRIGHLGASISIRNKNIQSGVALNLGGGDEGPNPHELLEAALAACTVITVQMYANRKGWKLDTVNVNVQNISETKDGAKYLREISFIGDLDEEQKKRLVEIADKCPIHLLLTRPIEILTEAK
jgi:putative redox protein